MHRKGAGRTSGQEGLFNHACRANDIHGRVVQKSAEGSHPVRVSGHADVFPTFSPLRVSHLIDTRLKELDATIAGNMGCPETGLSNSEKFLTGFGMTIYQAERDYLAENRHLLEAEALMAAKNAAD